MHKVSTSINWNQSVNHQMIFKEFIKNTNQQEKDMEPLLDIEKLKLPEIKIKEELTLRSQLSLMLCRQL